MKPPRNLNLLDCERFVAWTIAFTGCFLDGTGERSFYLELCAGVGNFSASMCKLGRKCIGVELLTNTAKDVINDCVAAVDITAGWFEWLVLDWIKRGLIAGIGAGVPCATFSRARRAPRRRGKKVGFPVAVRSNMYPWGLPDCSERDQKLVDVSNAVVKVCLRLIAAAAALMLPCWIENALPSILWYIEEFEPMKELGTFFQKRFAQCQFGTAAMKPTVLHLWNTEQTIDERWQLCRYKRCGGGSFCPVNNRKHVVLTGPCKACDGGGWKTSAASAYNPPLAEAMAKLVI